MHRVPPPVPPRAPPLPIGASACGPGEDTVECSDVPVKPMPKPGPLQCCASWVSVATLDPCGPGGSCGHWVCAKCGAVLSTPGLCIHYTDFDPVALAKDDARCEWAVRGSQGSGTMSVVFLSKHCVETPSAWSFDRNKYLMMMMMMSWQKWDLKFLNSCEVR